MYLCLRRTSFCPLNYKDIWCGERDSNPYCTDFKSVASYRLRYRRTYLVDDSGFEPLTFSMSRKYSTAEIIILIWCVVSELNQVLRIFSPSLNHQTSSPRKILSYCSFSTTQIFLSVCVLRTILIFSLSFPHQ